MSSYLHLDCLLEYFYSGRVEFKCGGVWYTQKWVCRKHGFSYLFGWFMEEIVRFRLIVEKNRKCNLSTLRGMIRGCMKTWKTFGKTQERPSRDWARRGSKKMKISSPAGNRRAEARAGGRPWSETRSPTLRDLEAVTGGRPSQQAPAGRRGSKIAKSVSLWFLSFLSVFIYFFSWDSFRFKLFYVIGPSFLGFGLDSLGFLYK